MKIEVYLRKILNNLYLSIKRFPMAIIFSTTTALTLIMLNEVNYEKDILERIAMILALGIPVSLCVKLFLEKTNEKHMFKSGILHISAILILTLYYFLFLKDKEMVSVTRYAAVSIALYSVFLFIPYFLKREKFEMYVISIFKGFFITTIYSIVLYLGLAAILFTIDKLLGIEIAGKVYYYTWLFVVFVFAVLYFLSQIPANDKEMSEEAYPKALKILFLYIIMPLLTVYTIILYIYFGKVIITSKWPVGLVAHLVLWYSIIALAVVFFITPVKSEGTWSNVFFKYLPKIILPLMLMMFVSIAIRINAYGVTERRYFVTILGIWVFFIMIYISFNKNARTIIIPITFSIIAFISVFGPLSSYTVSKISQNNRFEKILIKNKMLNDGKLQKSVSISENDKNEIRSILDYFNRNHSLKDIKYLPKNSKVEDIDKILGFDFQIEKKYNETFNFIRDDKNKYIDISGYDYIFDDRSLNEGSNSSNSYLTASYNYNKSLIKISSNGKEIYSKDLNSFVQQLINKHGINPKKGLLSPEDMTLVEENDKVKVKFVFLSISGTKEEETTTQGINFYVLIKMK